MEYMLSFLTVFVHIVAPDFVRIHGASKYASIPPSESDLQCALLAMSESCGSAHAEHVSLDWCDQSMQRSARADEANVIITPAKHPNSVMRGPTSATPGVRRMSYMIRI